MRLLLLLPPGLTANSPLETARPRVVDHFTPGTDSATVDGETPRVPATDVWLPDDGETKTNSCCVI